MAAREVAGGSGSVYSGAGSGGTSSVSDSYATANYGTNYAVSTDLSGGAGAKRWLTHPSLVSGPVPMPAHSTQTMGHSRGGAIGGTLGGAAILAPPAPPVSGGIAVGTYGPFAGSALPASFLSSSATNSAPFGSSTMTHGGVASSAAAGDAQQQGSPHSFGGGSPFSASAPSPTGRHLSSVSLGSGGGGGGGPEGGFSSAQEHLLGEFISSLDARTAVRTEPGASWQQ